MSLQLKRVNELSCKMFRAPDNLHSLAHLLACITRYAEPQVTPPAGKAPVGEQVAVTMMGTVTAEA